MPKGQLEGGNSSVEDPSYKMTLICVKLTKTNQNNTLSHETKFGNSKSQKSYHESFLTT